VIFYCWDFDNATEEDAEEIEAFDAETAAEEYAKDDDERGGDAPREEREVCVKHEDGTIERFSVELDWEPVYSASKV